MGVRIKEVRIRNFRSLESVDISFTDNCILIGANNAGKTSFLQAIQIAFAGSRKINGEDIFIKTGELLPMDRKAIIDVLITPTDENDNEVAEFDDVWLEHFGELRSEKVTDLSQFVAIRTIIVFDKVRGEYEIVRKGLIDWPDDENIESYIEYKQIRITERLLQAIPIFYMDAKRDISAEMKDKSSYWGKLVTDVGLNVEEIGEIEEVLDRINNDIINRSSVLKHLVKNLSEIAVTIDSGDESIKINPVSRRIRDLNRGIDITFKDKDAESFPISNHGMGTRSWITFLTLVAYVTWKITQMKDDKIPYHPLILLEEPESHLHPQAQRQIFKQMNSMIGQKIISTHSPMIVGQAEIKDVIHLSKHQGRSKISTMDVTELEEQDLRKIKQEIFKTRGDLLFARAILLCEGETEEQALPIFFKEFFGCESFEAGVNIVSVGGKGKYKPFLRIAKSFNINFYILSDGEEDTIRKVKKDVREVFEESGPVDNIKYLNDGYDFESYLLNEGYSEELNIAMKQILGDDYLQNYIAKKDNTIRGRLKTDAICSGCGQNVYEDIYRQYAGEEGVNQALLDCIHNNKTAYSSIIADIIVNNNVENKIPKIINDLFNVMEQSLKIKI
ncbi:AAA family ATPase [Paenibacillus polysaccharolyticus]|uniref:ATP-dependent nuclease n=1 Tax=Paenibacillus polysaccharolyticus TaxID=582692 RepID=UPI0020A0A051|nr:AAA family ATPase [Paenibacillus polysaccharolyticus]MCP1132400.1 AAA family ATPase [Paenibacillus polysaccharolyticus]